MAVQKITYDDKQYLNQQSDIADINKVKDTDMNMIKSVVNNNADEFINLTPVVLYSDSSGSTGNITLSDDISNYSYYEIIYSRQGSGYSSLRMPTSYITDVNFINSIYLGNILRFYSAHITISGTTLTRNYDNYINFTNTNALNFGTAPSLNIHKVIGYK